MPALLCFTAFGLLASHASVAKKQKLRLRLLRRQARGDEAKQKRKRA
jgi:hypothetical protein